MKTCDLCDRPAVVHEVTVRNGVKSEVHLCEECALQHGVATPLHAPIEQVLTKVVVAKPGAAGRRSAARACPTCGLRLADFRQTGLLGCPDCYRTFAAELEGVVERAHNGGTAHAGKTPRRGGRSIDQQHQIRRLARDLREAIAAEQYERAAALRDRLEDLEARLGGAPAEEG